MPDQECKVCRQCRRNLHYLQSVVAEGFAGMGRILCKEFRHYNGHVIVAGMACLLVGVGGL